MFKLSALGYQNKICLIQFMKKNYEYGEINVAVSWKLLPLEKQLELLQIETDTEIIIAGRNADDKVIRKADLVISVGISSAAAAVKLR